MDESNILVDFDFCENATGNALPNSGSPIPLSHGLSEIVCTNENSQNYVQSVSDDITETSAHCHRPRGRSSKTARNQLIIVSILCFAFMMIEIVGGVLSNSLALITDATHLASDLLSFFVGLFALWLAEKPATPRMSFGFHRAEVVGALLSIIIIWILTCVLLYLAIERLVHPDYEINANEMLIVASLGVAFNVVMGIVLSGVCCKCKIEHTHSHFGSAHSHSHSHDNGHSHLHADTHGNHGQENMNVRAALIHVIGDLIQSIGVLIAAIIIKINPDYKIADPICTFIFSVLVLITTATVLRDIFYVLMEASPRKIEYTQMKRSLQEIEGVKSAHSLHVWGLTMNKTAMSVHLAIDQHVQYTQVVKRASRMLRDVYGGYHVTVQTEPYQEIMNKCEQCIGPKLL